MLVIQFISTAVVIGIGTDVIDVAELLIAVTGTIELTVVHVVVDEVTEVVTADDSSLS